MNRLEATKDEEDGLDDVQALSLGERGGRKGFEDANLFDAVSEFRSRPEAVGLTTTGVCDDVLGKVIGFDGTVAGIPQDRVLGGHAIAQVLHEHLLGNWTFSNLPRGGNTSRTRA